MIGKTPIPRTGSTPRTGSGSPDSASGALLFVLTAAVGVGPLFNYGISVSSALLIREMNISAGQFGLVASVVFGSAALASFWLGWLSDRMSTRAQLVLIFGGASAALVIAAFAPSFLVLVFAALLAGLTQAISIPSTNRMVMQVVPQKKRAGWIGVKQSGVQASQLFAGLFFPAMALWLGWAGAAVGAAIVALGLLLYGLYVTSPARKVPGFSSASAPGNGAEEISQARVTTTEGSNRPLVVWIFAAIGLFSGFGMQATNVYLPLFSIEELNFSLVLAGIVAGASGVIGVASRIWWGRRMSSGAKPATLLTLIASGGILGAAAFLGAQLWDQPVFVWVGASLHGLTVLGVNVVINAGILDLIAPDKIGAASGVNAMGMYTGFALGPLVMGILRDITGTFTAGWILVVVMYAACLGTALFLRGHVKREEARRAELS